MQRILLALAVIVAVGGGVAASTGAFFSDAETSTGNTFAAGSIDLKLDSTSHYDGLVCQRPETGGPFVWALEEGQTTDTVGRPDLIGQPCGTSWEQTDLGPSNQFFNFTDVKPGDGGEDTISLHTTNDAYMCADMSVTSNIDGSGAASTVDSIGPVDFESFTAGNPNGQQGWTFTGPYDVAIASSGGTSGFGSQSLRISNAQTSGSFGDWVFAKPLTDAVGESDSTDGSFSPGTLQHHFEVQFQLASVVPGAEQPGLQASMAPDRGDGSRMSYLRFEDQSDGVHVFFDDVTDLGPVDTTATFNEVDIATLNRAVPHTIKLTMDTPDGPSNDVVRVWIDGSLVHTGTSWENYYRYDPEASAEQSPRIVKTVIFQARDGSGAAPSVVGKGFLIDNLSLSSGSNLFGGDFAQGTQFFAWVDNSTDGGTPGDNIHQANEPGLFGPEALSLAGTTTLPLADSAHGTPFSATTTNYIGLAWCAGTMTVNSSTGEITCDGASMGNEAQNDTMTADVTLRAEQSRNNPNFLCSPQ